MNAFRITQPRTIEGTLVSVPVPGPTDVLVRVKMLGLCGSDLKTYRGENPLVGYPLIPGHEIAGEIADRGERVPEDYRRGMLVTVVPYSACGTCAACRAGRANCCRDNRTMGVQRAGAAAQLIAVPYAKVLPAGSLKAEQAVLVEPLSVGWHAIDRGGVSKHDTVLVFGCGVIGLGAIAAAAHRGATVVAADIDAGKLEKARAFGAKHVLNSREGGAASFVEDITCGEGADVVVEAVGLPETYRQAVDLVSYAGRVVYIGYSKEPVCYETKHFVTKELDIRGSRNALDTDFEAVIGMLVSGRIDPGWLLTNRFPFARTPEAFEHWDSHPENVTKLVITFD